MPGIQRESRWVRAPQSLYLRGIGSVASFLPLVCSHQGSILEFFELIAVWAETAHFQLPTPRGYWRGLIPGAKENWDLPLRKHKEPASVDLGATWFPGTRLWLGETPSPVGRVSGSGLSREWVVFEPPPPSATGSVGPGIGI